MINLQTHSQIEYEKYHSEKTVQSTDQHENERGLCIVWSWMFHNINDIPFQHANNLCQTWCCIPNKVVFFVKFSIFQQHVCGSSASSLLWLFPVQLQKEESARPGTTTPANESNFPWHSTTTNVSKTIKESQKKNHTTLLSMSPRCNPKFGVDVWYVEIVNNKKKDAVFHWQYQQSYVFNSESMGFHDSKHGCCVQIVCMCAKYFPNIYLFMNNTVEHKHFTFIIRTKFHKIGKSRVEQNTTMLLNGSG